MSVSTKQEAGIGGASPEANPTREVLTEPFHLAGRPTHGASVAPDGHAVAHIVDDGGYPRAVQRFLEGLRVSAWRYVRLPVEGPITRVEHSPDGRWLACQVLPHGEDRPQVWVVTTDPRDPDAWRVDDSRDEAAELVGWTGIQTMLAAERADGLGESRLVDPYSLQVSVADVRWGGRMLDSWQGASLVRTGGRGDRSLRLVWGPMDEPLLEPDPGSVTDIATIVADRRPHFVGGRVPLVSPNGKSPELTVLLRSDVGADRQRLLLCTVDGAGTRVRVVAERPNADLDTFRTSADARRAVLLWNVRGGCSEVQVLDLDELCLHPPIDLWDGQGGERPTVAGEPSLSGDGRLLALTIQRPDQDRTVELFDLATGERRAVDEPVADPRAVMPSLETWQAGDGLELSGWLYRAPGAAPDAPVLVHLHGGPEGQERPGYSHLYPELLEAGITVFAPNVRGSGGFGRGFSHADDVGLRGASISDVVDTIDHLLARGIASPGRVAVAGWSYGGYLTMATMAFNPGIAACGIAVSGMSSLHTFFRTTEPWIARAAVPKYGDPHDEAELLERFSPLGRAERVEGSLLLVHGANDTNVPPTESTQMAEAVLAAGGRARCVLLDGEGHEIVTPANRFRLARMVRDEVLASLR